MVARHSAEGADAALEIALLKAKLEEISNEIKTDKRHVAETYFTKSGVLKYATTAVGIIAAFLTWFDLDVKTTKTKLEAIVEEYYKANINKNITSDIDAYYKSKVSPALEEAVNKRFVEASARVNADFEERIGKLKTNLLARVDLEDQKILSKVDSLFLNMKIDETVRARMDAKKQEIDQQLAAIMKNVDNQVKNSRADLYKEVTAQSTSMAALAAQTAHNDFERNWNDKHNELTLEIDRAFASVRQQINPEEIKSSILSQLQTVVSNSISKDMPVKIDEMVKSDIEAKKQDIDRTLAAIMQNVDNQIKENRMDLYKKVTDQSSSMAALATQVAHNDFEKRWNDKHDELTSEINKAFDSVRQQINADEIRNTIVAQLQRTVSESISNNMPEIQLATSAAVDKQFSHYFGSQYADFMPRLADAAKNFAVDSGYFLCGPKDRPADTSATSFRDENTIVYKKDVAFHRSFARPPEVIISLNSLDATPGDNSKFAIWVDARNTTSQGFQFVLKSLMKDVHNCKVHWVAIDQFSPASSTAGGEEGLLDQSSR